MFWDTFALHAVGAEILARLICLAVTYVVLLIVLR